MVRLLENLMKGGYALIGPHKDTKGIRWCEMGEVHKYYMYVKLRTTPIAGEWPDLQTCLASDKAAALPALWGKHHPPVPMLWKNTSPESSVLPKLFFPCGPCFRFLS